MKAAKHNALGVATGFAVTLFPTLEKIGQGQDGEMTLLGFGVSIFLEWGAGALFGGFGAWFLDWMESSKKLGPNHRGVFHSIAVLAGMCYLIYMCTTNGWGLTDRPDLITLLPFAGGYASHLAADFLTPKRLPLIVRKL